MILYHGSYIVIKKPDLSFSRFRTDFGKGFYVTPLKEQAFSWSQRFLRERGTAAISFYDFLPKQGDKLPPDKKILEFNSHSLEWLNFITTCRLGQPGPEQPNDTIDWDLIIGGVANDKVFDTLQLYFDGLVGPEEAIGRLRYNKPNFQYCFKKQSLLDEYLNFTGSEVLK